jgi:putative flippase GtrA
MMKNRDLKQFFLFCCVGGSNTIISLIAYYILLKIGINYLLSSTLAYGVGIVNGYILSTKFVFSKDRELTSMVKFVCVYLSSLVINLSLLYILVDKLGVSKYIAQLPVIGLNVIYNYIINKIWTFK